MKKYSSKKCHRGKTAYRTPSGLKYRLIKKTRDIKIKKKINN